MTGGCRICGNGDGSYSVSARNFDETATPRTIWSACRGCWDNEHHLATDSEAHSLDSNYADEPQEWALSA